MTFRKCDNCGNDFPEEEIDNHKLYCLFTIQQKEMENLIPCEICDSLIHISEYNYHILSCQSFNTFENNPLSFLSIPLNFNLINQSEDEINSNNENVNDNIPSEEQNNDVLEQINNHTDSLQEYINDLNNLINELNNVNTYDNLIELDNNNVCVGVENIEEIIEKKDEEILCPICTTKCEVKGVTKCGHEFCYDCIEEWLKENKKCPVCMIELN